MTVRHKQVQRTRRLVVDAFAKMLVDVPFDEIKVGELTTGAGVSRQSFYRLFGSKEGVLAAYFSRLFDEFEDEALRHRDDGPNAPFHALFHTLGAHAGELRVFGQPRLRGILFEALVGYQARLLPQAAADDGLGAPAVDPSLVTYQTGGIAALIMDWVEHGMTGSPESVADLAAQAADAFRGRPEYLPALLATRQAMERAGKPSS